MNKLLIAFTVLFIFSTSLVCFGQEKRVCKKNVSTTLKNYIETNFTGASKIKYYQETKNEITYLESTFEFEEENYSLKFLNDSLIETEIEMEFKQLPSSIQKTIKSSLDSNFSKYKILEVQKIDMQDNPMYEISLKGKKDGKRTYFEFFFDKKGLFISKEEIISKPIPSQF